MGEGYEWRNERDWEKRAVELSLLLAPWSGERRLTPQQILDAIHGKGGEAVEAEFDRLAGTAQGDPVETMLKVQAARKEQTP